MPTGPSFNGPLTGWTAASLAPTAKAIAEAPVVPAAPVATPTSSGNLAQYQLGDLDFGLGLGRPTVKPKQTGLESLLAAIFPDAAAEGVDLNTILGSLGQTSTTPGFVAPNTYTAAAPVNNGAALANTIPGAPAFLGSAVNNVVSASPVVAGAKGSAAGLTSLPGIAAIAAEQRIQQELAAKKQQEQQADFFNQLQQHQATVDAAARLTRLKSGLGVSTAPTPLKSTPSFQQATYAF